MAGIYIHIPFCKKACHYCNFHFSTQVKRKDEVFNSILKEIELQKNYLQNELVESIYLGGGTPSLLSSNQLNELFQRIENNFVLSEKIECTLEANPDDLSTTYLKDLSNSFINRLSIGVQTFYDEGLQWMNRSHNTQQATDCIKNAQDIGLDNITIDFIYGYPALTNEKWLSNIEQVKSLEIPHFSAYCLTVEEKTTLFHQINTGKINPLDDTLGSDQFKMLIDQVHLNNWHHYEISNIAVNEAHIAIHNSNYWKDQKYLGLGPSAHSFNGETRQWNIANNSLYLRALNQGVVPFEVEKLSVHERANEYIMTSLRTVWGCSLTKLKNIIGAELGPSWMNFVFELVEKGWLLHSDNILTLTSEGKLFADHIASELFLIEE